MSARQPRIPGQPLPPSVINLHGYTMQVIQAAAAQTQEVQIALNAFLQGQGNPHPYRLVVTGAKLVLQKPDDSDPEGTPVPPPPTPEKQVPEPPLKVVARNGSARRRTPAKR